MKGPCTEWTFRGVDRLVDELPCVRSAEGGWLPHAKFVPICLSDDRRSRGVQQVDGGHVERQLEVFNDQAMQRVSQYSRIGTGGEHSFIYLKAPGEQNVPL